VLPTFSKALLLLVLAAIRIAKDVGILGLLFVGLWGAEAIRDRVPLAGWVAKWIIEVHQWVTLIVYVIFAALLVWDMVDIHRGRPNSR